MPPLTLGYGPAWRIDGPPPQKPLYTLLDAVRVIEDVDEDNIERWGNGVEVHAFPSDIAHAFDACSSGADRIKSAGGTITHPVFGAIVVWFAETCSTFGIFGADMTNEEAQARFLARALAAFGAVEAAAVEREFLAGDKLANNPHLADGNGVFPWGNGTTSVLNAFALLETEIAKTGRAGVIHCSPAIATGAKARHLLPDSPGSDGKIRTVNGTVVVPGYGYAKGFSTPTAPHPSNHAGPGPTQDWVYATGPVEVRRSEPLIFPDQFQQAHDRETNTLTYRVERIYAVSWDTVLQAAVLADWCSDSCGSPPS